VPRDTKRKAFPSLAAKVGEEWRTAGLHRAADDRRFDCAVVHASNDMHYDELIAVMDAVAGPKRTIGVAGKSTERAAFYVTFAMA
jgi:hypothetical protein